MSLIRPPSIRSCSGFTYIGLLILVAIMGVTLAMIGTFWHTAQQHAREQQLLFIGNQFSSAIYAYYQNPPSTGTNPGIKQFPKRLEDLLQDNRQPNTVRYLRKIFADPITGKFQWGLIKGADGGIVGVYSLSKAAPLKTANSAKAMKNLPTRNIIPNGSSPIVQTVARRLPQSAHLLVRPPLTPLRPNTRFRQCSRCRPNPLLTRANITRARSYIATMQASAQISLSNLITPSGWPAWLRRISAMPFAPAAGTRCFHRLRFSTKNNPQSGGIRPACTADDTSLVRTD